MDSRMEILLKSLDLIIENQLWPEKKPSEVLRILLYTQERGWIYTPNIDGDIKAVICAYRIKDVSDESLTKMPVKDEGNILYVPFIVSTEKDKSLFHVIRESCKIYLEQNPDIEELAFEDKNNNIKRYNLKGALNGQEQVA